MYLTVGAYSPKDQFVRFYVISVNAEKKSIAVRQKALPYLFTEHFYQRIVDRLAVHDKDRLLKTVHDEYFEIYGLATLLFGVASLNSGLSYFPVPFLKGFALVYLFVSPKDNTALVNAGFLVRNDSSIAKNDDVICPIHSFPVKDGLGNEHLIGMRFSTWIHENDATDDQLHFGEIVSDFMEANRHFLQVEMSEHLSNKLPEAKQKKWLALVNMLNDLFHASMSETELRNACFEPKSLQPVQKVAVSPVYG
jgi:hypothetical protein